MEPGCGLPRALNRGSAMRICTRKHDMMRFGHDAGAPVNRLTVHVQALGLRGALCSEQKRRGAMPGATEAVLDRGDWRATPVPCSCLAETTRDRAGSAQGMMLASAGQHHAASAGAGAVRGHAGVLKLLEKLRHGLRVGDTKLEKLQTRCGPRARSAAPRDPATRGRGPAWADAKKTCHKNFAFQSVKVLCLQARWMRHYIHNAAHFDPYKGFVRKRGVRRHRLRRGRP